MRWKILIILLGIVGVAGGALRFFWFDEKDVLIHTTNVVLREPDIQIEAFSEEHSITAPEEQREDDAGTETVITEDTVDQSDLETSVPFTAQAPFGEWNDPVFQNGCEEASLVMVAHWLSDIPLTKAVAKQEILALADFEEKWLGHSVDTSVVDTLRLFQDYYTTPAGEVRMDIERTDIQEALAEGFVVIVPVDGRKLQNPHFRQPGPERHMLVIVGYDASTEQFITHDPGTRYGERYRYASRVLFDAIGDYPTGDHLPVKTSRKAMIRIKKL